MVDSFGVSYCPSSPIPFAFLMGSHSPHLHRGLCEQHQHPHPFAHDGSLSLLCYLHSLGDSVIIIGCHEREGVAGNAAAPVPAQWEAAVLRYPPG